MGSPGESEKMLEQLANGRDWVAPALSRLQAELKNSRDRLTAQARSLFESWSGEASQAARKDASELVSFLIDIELYCEKVEKAIRADNAQRQHDCETALQKLPSGQISDSTHRALMQGATIASPIAGGIITFATKGLLDEILSNQREDAARRELARVERFIKDAASDLSSMTQDKFDGGASLFVDEGGGSELGGPVSIGTGVPNRTRNVSGGSRRPTPLDGDHEGGPSSVELGNGNRDYPVGTVSDGLPHEGDTVGPNIDGQTNNPTRPTWPQPDRGGEYRPGGGEWVRPGAGIGDARGPSQDSSLNGVVGGPGVGLRGGLAGAVGLVAGAKLAGGSGGALGAGGAAGVGGGVGGLGGGAGVSGGGGLLGGSGAGAGSGAAGASAAGKAAGASAGAGRPGGSGLLGGGQGAGGANAEKKRSGSGGYIAPKFEEDPERGPASLAAGPGKRVKKKPAEQ